MTAETRPNAIRWFEIYVEDMGRARTFYESVFNVKLEKLVNPETIEQNIEMWAFTGNVDSYGSNGALVSIPGFPVGGNSVIVYFACEDCAQEEARARDCGGTIHKSKFAIGEYGFISLIHDTEGNMIGLHSMQ